MRQLITEIFSARSYIFFIVLRIECIFHLFGMFPCSFILGYTDFLEEGGNIFWEGENIGLAISEILRQVQTKKLTTLYIVDSINMKYFLILTHPPSFKKNKQS